MQLVNENIKRAVKIEMARRGLETKKAFAEFIDVSPQYVSEMLDEGTTQIPKAWAKVFEKFGWRVAVLDEQGKEVK